MLVNVNTYNHFNNTVDNNGRFNYIKREHFTEKITEVEYIV